MLIHFFFDKCIEADNLVEAVRILHEKHLNIDADARDYIIEAIMYGPKTEVRKEIDKYKKYGSEPLDVN